MDSTVQHVLPCGRVLLIDECDAHLLSEYRWYSDKKDRTFYARGRLDHQHKGGLYIHNLIMAGAADHHSGNGLDNRRSNLRRCTTQQNLLNRRAKVGKRFKGVYRRTASTFYAQCIINGVTETSGGHRTEEDAARAYDEMAVRLHGEFARLNFPKSREIGA